MLLVRKSELMEQASVRERAVRGCNLIKDAMPLGPSSGPSTTQHFLLVVTREVNTLGQLCSLYFVFP